MKQKEFEPRGKFLVWVEYNDDDTVDVYSTDSTFWRDFFK